MEESQPPATSVPLTPHAAKRLFRALLPIFAGYWYEASIAPGADAAWTDYLAVLRACQVVLDHAPMHPNEAKQVNAERRLERALEVLVTALHTLMTNLGELDYYVMDEQKRERRRRQGLNRYTRAKQARRKRRKR